MKKSLLILIAFASLPCFASYTGNHSSTVSWIKIYNSETIYFKLASMPADHQCGNDYFILSTSITETQRDRYYSMLLAAKASGDVVTVGYDKNNPDCLNDRPLVHALAN